MNTTVFTQQVEAMSNRLAILYQGIDISSSLPPALLPSALKELGVASERLEVAANMLRQQNRKLSLADQSLEAERQHHQALLEFIPDAYLLTDAAGIIQEANSAATKLLQLPQSLLIGKSLKAFLTRETQQAFEAELQRLQQRSWKQEWQIRLQPYQSETFNVSVLVEVNRPQANQPLTVRWLLRQSSDRSKVQAQEQSESNAVLGYRLQVYHKGEIIPLNPSVIWQV